MFSNYFIKYDVIPMFTTRKTTTFGGQIFDMTMSGMNIEKKVILNAFMRSNIFHINHKQTIFSINAESTNRMHFFLLKFP